MVNAGSKLSLFVLGLVLTLPAAAHAQAAASVDASSGDVQKVIAQLNAAAAKFVSAQADFSWEQYQAVVQESDTQSGTIYFERKKGATRTAADFELENGKPAPKTVVYDGGEVNFYQPAIKQITVMRAGANRGQWESFLTLGFGGSGTELQANWKVALQGTETISGVSVSQTGPGPGRSQGTRAVHARDDLGRPCPGCEPEANLLRAWWRQANRDLHQHPLQPADCERRIQDRSRPRDDPGGEIRPWQRTHAIPASTKSRGKHSSV